MQTPIQIFLLSIIVIAGLVSAASFAHAFYKEDKEREAARAPLKKVRGETIAEEDAIITLYEKIDPNPTTFITRLSEDIKGPLAKTYLPIVEELYKQEFEFPKYQKTGKPYYSPEYQQYAAKYRQSLVPYKTRFSIPDFQNKLHQMYFTSFAKFLSTVNIASEPSQFSTPLISLLGDKSLEMLFTPLNQANCASANEYFTYYANMQSAELAIDAKLIVRGSPDHYKRLLRGTAFACLAEVEVPVPFPEKTWFEHIAVWGTQGKGKTTLLQALIADRLPLVIANKASIFVMDSQGTGPDELIHSITHLKLFSKGQPLHNRLIFIEPSPTHPIAMNPFAMGRDRRANYSEKEGEQLRNQTIELLTSVFSAQEGVTFTNYQGTLYRFCIELLLAIPDAKLTTLQEILTEGIAPYTNLIPKLSKPAQTFFNIQFKERQFQDRAKEVSARLSGILQNNSIAGMFDADECKLDFYKELGSSKVIVVSADKDYLAGERCTLYGRLMISCLLRAAQERATLPRSQRMPIYAFLDEAHDYIKDDPNIDTIISQARKMNVSLTCANQRTGQINHPKVLDALLSTHTTFASTANERDAHTLAPMMHTKAEFLRHQPEHHFAFSVQPNQAVSVPVPLTLTKAPHMGKEEFEVIREQMRERYSYRPRKEAAPEPEEEATPSGWGEPI